MKLFLEGDGGGTDSIRFFVGMVKKFTTLE